MRRNVTELRFAELWHGGGGGVPIVPGVALVPRDVSEHRVDNIPGIAGVLWGHLRFQESQSCGLIPTVPNVPGVPRYSKDARDLKAPGVPGGSTDLRHVLDPWSIHGTQDIPVPGLSCLC